MWSLLRNPLIRFLIRLWWLPTLALMIVAFGLGGKYVGNVTTYVVSIIAFYVAALFVIALIEGLWMGSQQRSERFSHEHRFLCPDCLRFGYIKYACKKCGHLVDNFVVDTAGAFVKKCAHCHLALFTDEDMEGSQIRAYCQMCYSNSDRAVYHNKSIRTVAALTAKDFAILTQNAEIEIKKSQDGISYAIRDYRGTLTFVLNLADLNNIVTPDSDMHALRDISSIWTDCSETDALELGQIIDAMVIRAKLPEAQWRGMTICVLPLQIDAASQHVLQTRFGKVSYRVSPDNLLQGKRLKIAATEDGQLTAARF